MFEKNSNNTKSLVLGLVSLLMILIMPVYGQAQQSPNAVFQVATLSSLMSGVYEGEMECKELRKNGDFGIGTFNYLDGEMVVLDGKMFQVRADGKVLPVGDGVKTPFAAVTFFKANREMEVANITSMDELRKVLEKDLTNSNLFYGIRIDGEFEYVKTRSVPKQEKPYRPLAEVTKNQPTFEFQNVKGTLVGFWCPNYVGGLNVPGFHLHFISDDRQMGGHLLDCRIVEGKTQIDDISQFIMVLPESDDFNKINLAQDWAGDIKKVEK